MTSSASANRSTPQNQVNSEQVVSRDWLAANSNSGKELNGDTDSDFTDTFDNTGDFDVEDDVDTDDSGDGVHGHSYQLLRI